MQNKPKFQLDKYQIMADVLKYLEFKKSVFDLQTHGISPKKARDMLENRHMPRNIFSVQTRRIRPPGILLVK